MIMLTNKCLVFIIAGAGLLITSCEDVIDLDLKKSNPAIVIEANVTNNTNIQGVKISRTQNISEPNQFVAVTDAEVTITDNAGKETVFYHLPKVPGFYATSNLRGKPLQTYHLKVALAGKIYTSSSTMPAEVKLDSIGIISNTFFNKDIKSIAAVYKDPLGIANNYRFVLYINNERTKSIFAFDDKFNDGKEVTVELRNDDGQLKTNDVVKVEMQSIDQNIFKYFDGLSQNESRGGASTTPANPVSNISNGALGYFSAHTAQAGIIKIK